MNEIYIPERFTTFDIKFFGVGATGSNTIPLLTQLINGLSCDATIKLIDGDVVETKNSKNQKFLILSEDEDDDTNKFKAQVLAERYGSIYKNLDISFLNEYAKDKERVVELLQERTGKYILPLLVGTVDNNPTRKIFHEAFYDERIPNLIYIDSGNMTESRVGQVVCGLKLNNEVILSPVGDMFEEILKDTDSVNTALSCGYVAGEKPQHMSTNILAATTVYMYLCNIIAFRTIPKHFSYFDAFEMEINSH